MTSHVEQRLNERVAPATAEMAFDLLRDSKWLAGRLQQWFHEQQLSPPQRVALPLGPNPDGPHLLVTAEGKGVTCLAAGMAFDVPVMPFSRVRILVRALREGLRLSMAFRRREELEEEGWDLSHTLMHAYNMTRARFDKVRLLAPLLAQYASTLVEQALRDFNDLSKQSRREVHLPRAEAERTWRLISAASMSLMAAAFEPGIHHTAVRAYAMLESTLGIRGQWILVNRPPVLFDATDFLHHVNPALGCRMTGPLLRIVAARFPAFRPEALARLEWMDAVAREHPEKMSKRRVIADEVDARSQVDKELIVEFCTRMLGLLPSELVETLGPEACATALILRAQQVTGTVEERLAAAHRDLGEMCRCMDPFGNWGRLPTPHLVPLEDEPSDFKDRVLLWQRLVNSRWDTIRHEPVGIQVLLGMTPQEALVPRATPDPSWRLSEGAQRIGRVMPDFARQGQRDRTVHRAPEARPNDPCPCGSGRKFKKCCAMKA